MKQISIAEILALPVQERIRLVELIWESIAAVPEAVEVTPENKGATRRAPERVRSQSRSRLLVGASEVTPAKRHMAFRLKFSARALREMGEAHTGTNRFALGVPERGSQETRRVQEVWVPTQSGVLIPSGRVLERSARKKTNFLHVKGRAQEIQDLYASAGLTMSPSCGLARLIENAKRLSDRWLTNQTADTTMIDVFYALQLDRIAEALLPLRDVPGRAKYLTHLTSGEIDFFKRESSHAKNIFWEVELWSVLRRNCSSASLQDPPDIVLDLIGGRLGIPCKKLYSENNVEKVLSEAVSQVEDDFDVGVVAINLDDLTPADTVVRAKDKADMDQILHRHNDEFLRRHERHLRRYLASGRLVAALVAVNVIAEVLEWRVPFNNVRVSTIWTIPGLVPDKVALLRQFRKLVVV